MDSTYPEILVYNGQKYPFNPARVRYSAPSKTAHGSYVIRTTYALPSGTEVPVVLQTPVITSQFGFGVTERDGQVKGGIDLTFLDTSPPDVMALKRVMAEWDALILKTAKENRLSWFQSKKATDDIIDYLHCPLVRENVRKSDGMRFADALRPKVRHTAVQCYDAEGNSIEATAFGPRSLVRAMLKQTGIWLSDSMFVASMEATHLQLMESPTVVGFPFVDSGDDRSKHGSDCESE